MTTTIGHPVRIDMLNIGLIVISFILALVLPIRLFLFSYIILGPLHYLTEIGWLDKRNYFSKRKGDRWILVFLTVFLSVSYYFSALYMPDENTAPFLRTIYELNNPLAGKLVFWAFGAALAMVFVKERIKRYLIILCVGLLSLLLHYIDPVLLLFGIFVPTIIHVSVFTMLFMIYGALKSNSRWGLLASFIFFAGWIGCFIFYKNPSAITANMEDFQILLDSTFIHLGSSFSEFLGMRAPGSDYLLLSKIGIQVQTLFAFCYTYHYLNWFSKTKVINWHEVSRNWLIATGILWIASITIYAIDYRVGFMALFFLSMLHVLLEFPLNHLSFYGIIQELKVRIS